MSHEVYRHFSKAGELLYVGCSISTFKRMHAHRHGSRWWKHVTRIEIERFSTREDALIAELMAIQTEFPKYNKMGRVSRKWAEECRQARAKFFLEHVKPEVDVQVTRK